MFSQFGSSFYEPEDPNLIIIDLKIVLFSRHA